MVQVRCDGAMPVLLRPGLLLGPKTVELFVTALEKTPDKDLVGNNGNSTLYETSSTISATSAAQFRSSYCCLALPAVTSRSY
jgi:hypothetical protein